MTEVTEGPYKGYVGEEPEYEALAGMSAAIGNTDPGATVMLGNEIDRLGMDVNESSYTIAWMMECYEKGLLSKDDLDGLEMTWGNVEATLAMLKKIAYREGVRQYLCRRLEESGREVWRRGAEVRGLHAEGGDSPRTRPSGPLDGVDRHMHCEYRHHRSWSRSSLHQGTGTAAAEGSLRCHGGLDHERHGQRAPNI